MIPVMGTMVVPSTGNTTKFTFECVFLHLNTFSTKIIFLNDQYNELLKFSDFRYEGFPIRVSDIVFIIHVAAPNLEQF